MRNRASGWLRTAVLAGAAVGLALSVGCGAGGLNEAFDFIGTPFGLNPVGGGPTGPTGPGGSVTTPGGSLGGNDRTNVDPCTEPEQRKFIRISMRNSSDDFVHYFLVMVAFINGDVYADGAVCEEDVALYTRFGYQQVPAGQSVEFGNFCIVGPALYYFHRSGQFRGAGGGTNLASAIAPALGTTPTYDAFFSSSGAVVPVPNLIGFHNPGSGEGAALKVSVSTTTPCALLSVPGDPNCQQDAFYYVDDGDRFAGSTALGAGSGRRVPSEIQGTGCECLGVTNIFQVLAPSRVSGANANCNEFLRGGRIDYVFLRQDENPPFPQLVWRVTDAAGAVAHDFDSRASVR